MSSELITERKCVRDVLRKSILAINCARFWRNSYMLKEHMECNSVPAGIWNLKDVSAARTHKYLLKAQIKLLQMQTAKNEFLQREKIEGIFEDLEFMEEHMTNDLLSVLATIILHCSLAINHILYWEDEVPSLFYVIASGSILVKRRIYDGILRQPIDMIVREIGPGDFIAGYELCAMTKMQHTYVARTNVELVSVDFIDFCSVLKPILSHFWLSTRLPTTDVRYLYSYMERQLFVAMKRGLLTAKNDLNLYNFKFDSTLYTEEDRLKLVSDIFNMDIENLNVRGVKTANARMVEQSLDGIKLNFELDICTSLQQGDDAYGYFKNLQAEDLVLTEIVPYVDSSSEISIITVCKQTNPVDLAKILKYFTNYFNKSWYHDTKQLMNTTSINIDECNPNGLVAAGALNRHRFVLGSPLIDTGLMISLLRNCGRLQGDGLVQFTQKSMKPSNLMQVFCSPKKWLEKQQEKLEQREQQDKQKYQELQVYKQIKYDNFSQ